MKNIFIMQAFISLANAFVGIFYPFLLMDTFGLSFAQILLVVGIEYGVMGLLVYPVQKISGIKVQQKVAVGIFFLFCSLLVLSTLSPQFLSENIFFSYFFLALLVGIIALSLAFLWPAFHWINIALVDSKTRGRFLGNIQVIIMGSLIVGPFLSGVIIDWGYGNYVLLCAGFLYAIAFIFALKIPVSNNKNPELLPMPQIVSFFTTQTLQKHFLQASLVEAVQTSSLILVYPILLKITLHSYAMIGGMFFVMATVEIISAKVFGHLTDKYSSKKMIKWGAFARFLDIAPRGLLAFFPSSLFASVLSISAGILGPLFGVSFYSQLYDRAEKSPDIYSFLVSREWILGLARFIFFGLSALFFWLFGVYALAFALFLAGFLSFFLKKM
jgi:hypothetical protein